MIFSTANLVYELPQELPNDLRLRILLNKEILLQNKAGGLLGPVFDIPEIFHASLNYYFHANLLIVKPKNTKSLL